MLMGAPLGGENSLQGLANTMTNGDLQALADNINDFFVSVSSDLPPPG